MKRRFRAQGMTEFGVGEVELVYDSSEDALRHDARTAALLALGEAELAMTKWREADPNDKRLKTKSNTGRLAFEQLCQNIERRRAAAFAAAAAGEPAP